MRYRIVVDNVLCQIRCANQVLRATLAVVLADAMGWIMCPRMQILKSRPQCDDIQRWDLWEIIRFKWRCEDRTRNFLVQSCSVSQSCPTLCYPTDCSMPVFPVHHQLPDLTQTHVHWVDDAIQPSHPLSSPSPPAFNLSQHQGLFRWVSSSHQVAKILEFQLQHQSFQCIFRTDFL